MNQLTIDPKDYVLFSEYLENQCGIILGENKQYLVQSRMAKVLRDEGIESFDVFLPRLKNNAGRLRQKTIDAMTTNETLWFRDSHPFDYFQNTLLPLITAKKNRIRIWCAACSTGQEPYSISIIVDELYQRGRIPRQTTVEIVATDISSEVLEQAKKGVYSRLALGRGLSPARMNQFFQKDGVEWRLKGDVCERVRFTQLNLKDSYSSLGKFDVIFCRNVLIYFNQSFKEDILRKIHGQMVPEGVLFLGASESMSGLKDLYTIHQYRPGIVYIAR